MGKPNSKIYVAKESFKSTNDTPGYISFEVRSSPPPWRSVPIVLDTVDVFLQVGDDLKEKKAKDKDWQETHEVNKTWTAQPASRLAQTMCFCFIQPICTKGIKDHINHISEASKVYEECKDEGKGSSIQCLYRREGHLWRRGVRTSRAAVASAKYLT